MEIYSFDLSSVLSPISRFNNQSRKKMKDPKKIVDILADHYEKHFEESIPNLNNPFHQECLSIYENIAYTPNIPLEKNNYQRSNKRIEKIDR